MNCREVRSYLEQNSLITDFQDESAQIAQHILGCTECSRLVEAQKETRLGLCLLRTSAPEVPTSLDAAVLANYRRQIATQPLSAAPWHWRTALLKWGLAGASVAALVVYAVIAVRKPSNTVSTPPLIVTPAPPKTAEVVRDSPPHGVAHKRPLVTPRPKQWNTNAVPRQAETVASASTLAQPFADDFRSLMYCDELICGGGMEVVRVHLPAQPAGLLLPSAPTNRVVSADVLVGADGFARGIRIVH